MGVCQLIKWHTKHVKSSLNYYNKNISELLKMNLTAITSQATKELQTRVQGKWFNADGTPKPNYIFKIADNTPKGDAGEQIVGKIFEELYTEIFPDETVEVNVVGGDKGDYDVIVKVSIGFEIKIEVKTATEDSNGKFQWNGLKKKIDYDYAFGLGVTPDDFVFSIQPREYLEETLTTNMSRDVEGSYKWSSKKSDNVQPLTEDNIKERLKSLNLMPV